MLHIRRSSLILTCLFITVGVVSNIISVKVIPWPFLVNGHQFTVSASTFVFIFMFMLSNLITEIEGKRYSTIVSRVNFLTVLVSVSVLKLISIVNCTDATMQVQFNNVFQNTFVFFVSGLIAYACSISVNMLVYSRLRYGRRVISISKCNALSMIVSQFVDVVTFTFLGYFVGSGWYRLPDGLMRLSYIIIGQYSVQIALILISSPLFNLIVRLCTSRTAYLNKNF